MSPGVQLLPSQFLSSFAYSRTRSRDDDSCIFDAGLPSFGLYFPLCLVEKNKVQLFISKYGQMFLVYNCRVTSEPRCCTVEMYASAVIVVTRGLDL